MSRIILLLAATALTASPSLAQHAGHNMPGISMPMPAKPAAKKPPAKKTTAKKPMAKKSTAKKSTARKPASKKPAATKVPARKPAPKPQPDPHAGHQMPAPEQPAADPHAGHQMPPEDQPAANPHAGHQMTSTPANPHAGHDMSQMSGPEPQPAPPPPEALTGPAHAADIVWDPAGMERGRNILRQEHGGMPAFKFLADRAETRLRNGRDGYLLDLQSWYGGDVDKLWLKSEIEGDWGRKPEHAEVQALWSHAIGPWFDLQAGARFDPQPGPNRSHLVLGVQGLAPYWWEVEGALFLSNKGELTARAEAEYDLRITQKLILQPRAEVDLSAQDISELGIGAGLSKASLGLRLRYQLSPRIAPYVGVEYERAFGGTRDFRRAEGERADGFNLLAGVRFWF